MKSKLMIFISQETHSLHSVQLPKAVYNYDDDWILQNYKHDSPNCGFTFANKVIKTKAHNFS